MIPKLPLSGLNYPNRIARITLTSIEQVVGKETMQAMLKHAALDHYIDALPPDNMERAFDFADFSVMCAEVDALDCEVPYKSGKTTRAEEAARLCYRIGLREFGTVAGFSQISLGFQVLPEDVRVKVGLIGMATVFTTLSDQFSEVADYPDHYEYIIHQCPICWGRHSNVPCCTMAVAMLEEGLFWLTKRHFKVYETECKAMGADRCVIRIEKQVLKPAAE